MWKKFNTNLISVIPLKPGRVQDFQPELTNVILNIDNSW